MLMVMIYCITVVAFSVATPISSSESREVSGRVKRSAAASPTTPQPCYSKYFAGGTQPTGLELDNPTSLRYLCHTASPAGPHYFSTLFDDTAGIAIFSAYTIDATQGVKIGHYKRREVKASWQKYPGLSKQGSDALYAGHGTGDFGIDKGHLNPSYINSYNVDYMAATFTYANAVPQFGKGSNRASWKKFERIIADHVRDTCATNGGTMYMLTGTSKYRFQVGAPPFGQLTQVQAAIQYFPAVGGIVLPNSVWTAGCCVAPKFTQSIAVMGNNDVKSVAETISMDLTTLEKLLVNSKMAPANLFPAVPACRTTTLILK